MTLGERLSDKSHGLRVLIIPQPTKALCGYFRMQIFPIQHQASIACIPSTICFLHNSTEISGEDGKSAIFPRVPSRSASAIQTQHRSCGGSNNGEGRTNCSPLSMLETQHSVTPEQGEKSLLAPSELASFIAIAFCEPRPTSLEAKGLPSVDRS